MIFVITLSLILGFKVGEASNKAEVYSSKQICFDVNYQNRKDGCYRLETVPK